MYLTKFCNILMFIIFISFAFCETSLDFLNEPISSLVEFGERRNHVLFALSKAANNTTFESLKNGFLELERQVQRNSGDNMFYGVAVSFGTDYKKAFTLKEKLYESYGRLWCKESNKCFESSQVANMEEVVTNHVMFNETCPNGLYKKFILVISDVCLPFLNQELNDNKKCSSDYRKIILMLPTKTEVEKCKNQLGTQLFIKLFSSELKSNEFEIYSDMSVTYETTWSKSVLNILVIIDNAYEAALARMFEPPSINFGDYDLCDEGALIAYFQFTGDNTQMTANLTTPIVFIDPKYFSRDHFSLINERGKYELENCDFVYSFLAAMKDMPLEDDKYQYNLLILSDPYPSCLNSNLLWDNTNRHFDIVVLGGAEPEKDYSKFISLSNNTLNHLTYYTANEGITQFWNDTSICKTNMPAKTNINYSKPRLITTTLPLDVSSSRDNQLWIIVGGAVVVFLLLFGAFVLIYYKLRNGKNVEPVVNLTVKDEPSPSTLSSFINKTFPDICVEESAVFINFDEILGQGSTCTVYQAKIKRMEEKTFAIKIPLQYENSHLEEVMHELSIVKRLGQHPSICLPILCTSHREIPCIIFDKMDTSLLFFVKNYFENGTEFPPKTLFLQILWQISNALEFIASKNIIHRDIAARNILFSAPNIAKLSDFGLWCECNTDSQIYFSSFRKKLPYKWLSIEAMKNKIFSEKSDVWSFGIVMYEMWSGGNVPYADKDANELMGFLLEGKRLEPPESMDNDVTEIMASCWKEEKEERPNFYELKTKFCNLLENERPEKYSQMN